jgi:hypothetical protein
MTLRMVMPACKGMGSFPLGELMIDTGDEAGTLVVGALGVEIFVVGDG